MICENGVCRELTEEELIQQQEEIAKNEADYWTSVPYEDGVNNEIRKRYTESQEFSILRQKEEKPEEYQAYYDYCEQCKAFVKEKKGEFV